MSFFKKQFQKDKKESGQATTEYIIMLGIVVSLYTSVQLTLKRSGIGKKFLEPVTKEYVYAYRYGSPTVRGETDGGPVNHPRFTNGGSFRLFINP